MSDIDKLREFAKRVFNEAFDHWRVDGCDIQEWGAELGLLKLIPNPDHDLYEGDEIYIFTEIINVDKT